MWLGYFYALLACLVWGLIFILPGFMSEFSPIEVTIGRYFSYGLLSLTLLSRKGLQKLKEFPWEAWKKALIFGLFSNLIYYLGVVFSLRYSSEPVTVLLLGLCPIVVAFYGNWISKEKPWKELLVPCFGIALGMGLVNFEGMKNAFKDASMTTYFFGLLCGAFALLSWAWYAVQNAQYLKKQNAQLRNYWATLIGAATFLWVTIFLVICTVSGHFTLFNFGELQESSRPILKYLACAAVLGILCSWVGCYSWNQASVRLPLSIMGTLIIFETIFGLLFVYIVDQKMPSISESLGIIFMLLSLLLVLFPARLKIGRKPTDKTGKSL